MLPSKNVIRKRSGTRAWILFMTMTSLVSPLDWIDGRIQINTQPHSVSAAGITLQMMPSSVLVTAGSGDDHFLQRI